MLHEASVLQKAFKTKAYKLGRMPWIVTALGVRAAA